MDKPSEPVDVSVRVIIKRQYRHDFATLNLETSGSQSARQNPWKIRPCDVLVPGGEYLLHTVAILRLPDKATEVGIENDSATAWFGAR